MKEINEKRRRGGMRRGEGVKSDKKDGDKVNVFTPARSGVWI